MKKYILTLIAMAFICTGSVSAQHHHHGPHHRVEVVHHHHHCHGDKAGAVIAGAMAGAVLTSILTR